MFGSSTLELVHYFYLWTFSYVKMPYKHVSHKQNIKTVKRNKEVDVLSLLDLDDVDPRSIEHPVGD